MWKIQSYEVCDFCILLYHARKSATTFSKCIQNSQTSHDCIFHILRYFATNLHDFTKFMTLSPAVLMNFPNSKVCPIGEWSIGPTRKDGRKGFRSRIKELCELLLLMLNLIR